MRFLSTNLDSLTRVTSSGNDDSSPHCSFVGQPENCDYTHITKQECAKALCHAQGYSHGYFASSSNDFCIDDTHTGQTWIYFVAASRPGYSGRTLNKDLQKKATITADCITTGVLKVKNTHRL